MKKSDKKEENKMDFLLTSNGTKLERGTFGRRTSDGLLLTLQEWNEDACLCSLGLDGDQEWLTWDEVEF